MDFTISRRLVGFGLVVGFFRFLNLAASRWPVDSTVQLLQLVFS